MSFFGAFLALAVFGETRRYWSDCEEFTLGNDCSMEVSYCNGYCAEACDESYDLVWEVDGAYCEKCPEGAYHLFYENSYKCLRALPATKEYGGEMNLIGSCETPPFWHRDFELGGCYQWTCPMDGTYLNWPAFNPSHNHGVMEPVCVGGDILADCPPGSATSVNPSGEIVCTYETGFFKAVEGTKDIKYHSYGEWKSEMSACGEDYWTWPTDLCCEAGYLTRDVSEQECGPWVCYDWGLDEKTQSCPCSDGWSCDVYDATVLPVPVHETYYPAEKSYTYTDEPLTYEHTATFAPIVNAKYEATVEPAGEYTYTTAPVDTAYTYTVAPLASTVDSTYVHTAANEYTTYSDLKTPTYTETLAPLTRTEAYTETVAPVAWTETVAPVSTYTETVEPATAWTETVEPAYVETTYTETFEPTIDTYTSENYDSERGCYFDPILGSGCEENRYYCDGYCSQGCDEGFSLLSKKEEVAGNTVYGMVCEACPSGYAHIWTESYEYQCIRVIPGVKMFGGYQNRIGNCREDPYWYRDGQECYTWECESGFQTVWPMCSDWKNCNPICADPAEVEVGDYCPVGMDQRVYEWKTSQTVCMESTDEVNVGVTEVLFHKYSEYNDMDGCDDPYPQDMCCDKTESGNSMWIYRDQSEIDCGPWICFDWDSEETGTPYPCN